MAAYAQFGYSYPSATQLLSTNATQSSQTGAVSAATSSIPTVNAPAVSPTDECRNSNTNSGGNTGADLSSGALSPEALSQTSSSVIGSNSAVLNNTSGGVVGSTLDSSTLGPMSGATGGSCCENGRPIMTDPMSGQTVCSCQYDSARLALSSYSRLPAASVGVYGTPYPSTDQNPYQSIGVDSSAFYSPLSNPYALKDTAGNTEMTAWTSAGLQPTTGYYSYDPMSAYGYGAGYDLAARRKNATRESTATLKAWLNEHKKNPYPTKGEKIMLAIITKMTLTQVSTWFANARRRLKKENKMTWEPKNRTDDDDDALASDDEKDKEEPDDQHSISGGDQRKDLRKDEEEDDRKLPNQGGDIRTSLNTSGGSYYGSGVGSSHPHNYHPYHQHPAYYQHQQAMIAASYHSSQSNHQNNIQKNELSCDPKNQMGRDCGVPIPATKPKIWSLADTVACKTPPPTEYTGPHQLQQRAIRHQQYVESSNNNGSQRQITERLQQQQHPLHMSHIQQQQHTMSDFGERSYSQQAPTIPTFTGSTQQLHTMNSIPYTNSISNHFNNNNNNIKSNNHSSSNTHMPINPSTADLNSLQQDSRRPILRQTQTQAHAVNQRGMGFPEAQPDTPPQTPPNMKIAIAPVSLLPSASVIPTIDTCRSNSSNLMKVFGGPVTQGFDATYSTSLSDYSPRDDSFSGSSCSSGSPQIDHNEVAFKQLYKSHQLPTAKCVAPV